MKEYKHGNATVRSHGEYDIEKSEGGNRDFSEKDEEQREAAKQ